VCALLTSLRAAAETRGGHAILESGPADLKRTFPVWATRVANADLMQGLKQAFDPAAILGCGRGI